MNGRIEKLGEIEGVGYFRSATAFAPQRGDFGSPAFQLNAIRLADIAIALCLLIFALPLMLLVALAIKLSDPGPVLFAHTRVGRGGRMFRCLKFRTMMVDADRRLEALLATDAGARAAWARDHKLPSDPRITTVGRFLRISSLDELPQFWNVLRGDMSMVGPRPIVLAEVQRYRQYIGDYYRVRPGLTGLWQISGRSETTYRRRVALDVVYARTCSFRLYMRIILATVPAVLMARGSC